MDDTFWVPDSSFCFFLFFSFSGPIRDSYWCTKSQSHAASYPVKEKSKYLFFSFFFFLFFSFWAPHEFLLPLLVFLPTCVFVPYLLTIVTYTGR